MMAADRPKVVTPHVTVESAVESATLDAAHTTARPALAVVPALPRRLVWRPRALVPVCWCVRGMTVYVRKPGRGWVIGVVKGMAGYRAKLSNPMHGIDGWYHIDSLRVPPGSLLALRA